MKPGEQFAGRFTVLRTAAFGGMGRIYHAKDDQLGREVALKVLAIPNADAAITERFDREIRILRSLEHPNLVKAYEGGRTDEGLLYLVLEWLKGEDLSHRLRGGKLEPAVACAIVQGALRGLMAAHASGIVHRDLKPANIFLTADVSPPDGVKVLDFGVAKLVEDHRASQPLTMAGALIGTPHYMSPEQAMGKVDIDARADLFSLGSVLYECLTGHKPFEAGAALALLAKIASDEPKPVRELEPSLPEVFDAFVKKAMAKRPDARFQTADEMERAISGILGGATDEEDPATVINIAMPDLGPDLKPVSASAASGPAAPIFSKPLEPKVSAGGSAAAFVAHDTTTEIPPEMEAPPRRPSRARTNGRLVRRPSSAAAPKGLHYGDDTDRTPPPDLDIDDPRAKKLAIANAQTMLPARKEALGAGHAAVVLVCDLSAVEDKRRLAWALFQQAVQKHGGSPLPLQGGLAMGVFNDAPGSEDASERAVRASLQSLGMSADGGVTSGVRELRFGIGHGKVVAGAELGGEAIETAVAVLELAEPGEVVLDEETRRRVAAAHGTRPRGAKGHALVLPGGPSTPAPDTQRVKSAMVGREGELTRLLELYRDAAAEKRPACVIVSGGEGMGKTRLREELRRQLTRRGARASMVVGHGARATQSVPFGVFADALRRRGGIRGNENSPAALEKIDRMIPKAVGGGERKRLAASLAKVLGIYVPEPSSEDASSERAAEARLKRLRGAILDLVTAWSAEQPVVLVLEDVQWSDPASLGVVLELLKRPDRCPVLVMILARPEMGDGQRSALEMIEIADGVTRIDLEPLAPSSTRALAESLIPGDVDEALLSRIVGRSNGNPYLVEETVRAITSSGTPASALMAVREKSLAARLNERLSSVPANVQGLMGSRLDQLPEPLREVLRRAAVFEGHFWDGSLVALGIPEPKPLLEGLAAQDLIEPAESSRIEGSKEFEFKSTPVREAAYALLSENERAAFHRMAADWLAAQGDGNPLALVKHLRQAGDEAGAVRALLEGARKALASGDANGAVTLSQEGLQIVGDRRKEALELLAIEQQALGRLGNYGKALEALDAMASMPVGERRQRWLRSRRAELLLRRGESTVALKLFREAREAYEHSGEFLEAANASIGAGDALEDRGDTIGACSHYEAAFATARKANDPKLIAKCRLRLGRVAYATADLGQALRLFEEARRRYAEECDDRRGEADAAIAHGAALAMMGDSVGAIDALDVAEELLEVATDRVALTISKGYRAMVFSEIGRPGEARALLDFALREARSTESKNGILIVGLQMMRVMLDTQHEAEATELGRELHELAVRSLQRFIVPLESALGLALSRTGEVEEGLLRTESAVHRLDAQKACEDEDPQRIFAQYALSLELAGQGEAAADAWSNARGVMAEVESRIAEPFRPGFLERPINRLIRERTR